MKCGIDGKVRNKETYTQKKQNWKQRTGRDRSVVSRVGHFAHGPAQGGARTCRGATDSIHCRVWCHDMFSEFRVFRNSGRWSAKCSKTMWSMSLSWCIGFFPPKKEQPEYLRKLCEEPDCMCSENCVVWIATWVLTPINVVSSPLPSFLLYFLFKHLFWKNIRSRFFTFSLHFLKKFFFSCLTSLLKMFCPWPLQSDKIMQFSSWKDLLFFLIFF